MPRSSSGLAHVPTSLQFVLQVRYLYSRKLYTIPEDSAMWDEPLKDIWMCCPVSERLSLLCLSVSLSRSI